MIFPVNSIKVSPEKVRDYLLKPLLNNDKSNFLSLGGYKIENWEKLLTDILEFLATKNAELIEKSSYGDKYLITGFLPGTKEGKNLLVDTIWQKDRFDEFYRFITLYPSSRKGEVYEIRTF